MDKNSNSNLERLRELCKSLEDKPPPVLNGKEKRELELHIKKLRSKYN